MTESAVMPTQTPLRVTVLGCGYLGATHAAGMAELGHEVLGVENDPRKLAQLQSGSVPFFEPGLDELLKRGIDSGRLRFTDSLAEAGRFGSVHFLCVGTPQRDDSWAADLRYVDEVVDGLAPHLTGSDLLVGKSTVPVGTAEHVDPPGPRARPGGSTGGGRLEPRVPA